jgi:hypothetical protein
VAASGQPHKFDASYDTEQVAERHQLSVSLWGPCIETGKNVRENRRGFMKGAIDDE